MTCSWETLAGFLVCHVLSGHSPPPLSSRLEPDGGDLTAMFGRTGVWDASRCIMYQYWGVSWERSYTLEAAEAL